MGACTSSHDHKASTTMKLQVLSDSATKPDHTSVIHPSPTIGKLLSVMDEEVDVKPQLPQSQSPVTLSEYGSRDEAFFDSQAWLDSDYEDEFMSVNGEFTPSRGNTPVHHSLTQGTPRVNVDATFPNHDEPLGTTVQPSPTPTEKRKRLLDLFKESIRDNTNRDSNFEIDEPENKDGQMGLEKDGLKPNNDSHVGSMHGCFKSLLSVRITGKQKNPSPVIG
ncbi:hypothetical protein M8C21_009151 [Ambrosia artemisiifolia]|uniref:Uncharacterized protein n=1 Tax=Ambrosia artemisiifolia TaxID=4212 RepID=A0AAD5BQV8_AMBAR|nr:hypothetical protein M8C21_009151 [Ambrosia artemisiifolia]